MYTVTLTLDDYLRYQLFIASKSKKIKRTRNLRWLFTSLVFLMLSGIFIKDEDHFLFYYFLTMGLAALLLYPTYSRWLYKRHYKKHVKEYYKNRVNFDSQLFFDDEFLNVKDQTGEAKLKLSEIDAVFEIADNLFIRISSGVHVIIPKNFSAIESFISELKKGIAANGDIWQKELDWNWK